MTRRLHLLACMLLLSATAGAQTTPPKPVAYGAPVSLDYAMEMVDRTMAESARRGLRMAIAVVEPSGELVAFARMDGVPYASIRIAQQKARTAARFRTATSEFEQRVQHGRMVLLSSDEVIAVGGGVPIVVDGRVVGALGVSGGTSSEDAALATAIVNAR